MCICRFERRRKILRKDKGYSMKRVRETKGSGFLAGICQSVHYNKLGELLIQKGLITKQDLKNALITQKETSRPLGQVFIDSGVLSSWQLRVLLGRQFALRTVAAGILFSASLSTFTSKRAHAEPLSGVHMASTSAEFTRVSYYPKLLGTTEKKDRNLKAFTKWNTMFTRFDNQMKQQANAQIIKDFQNRVNGLQGRSMKGMVQGVNRLVNETKYVGDKRNWGQSDYWATPVEFLKRGGDCEDFAIAKYTALRSLGFPEERLRVAIVQDTVKNIPHAVLVAYTDEGAFILDNQIKSLVDAESRGRYKPIFSINRQAWWLHKAPSSTMIASAH